MLVVVVVVVVRSCSISRCASRSMSTRTVLVLWHHDAEQSEWVFTITRRTGSALHVDVPVQALTLDVGIPTGAWHWQLRMARLKGTRVTWSGFIFDLTTFRPESADQGFRQEAAEPKA